MLIHKTDAIVLNRRDYRETSYLVSLFTSDFGKIHAQAKGARRKIDKFGSSFSPITHNAIVFYESLKSDLHIVSQADLIEHFPNIDKNVEKFGLASYIIELISAAIPFGEKNREIFDLVMKFLKFLDKNDKINNIAQIFEIKFLDLSGFKPRLDYCVHCTSQMFTMSKFSYVLGGLLCEKCYNFDINAHNLMQGTVATIEHIEKTKLEDLQSFKIISSISVELEQILRRFIDFHLGIQFKSLEFLKKLRLANV
ncbi:MAG: DNA repair protein RecO [Candidatus Omnitrophica bacterium]|nr:DNA repair protein RecO [Candidatus Omnitrophota bacterium]